MSISTLLPSMTFPPVSWWLFAIRLNTWELAENEHWAKQSFRNRYEIAGPNDRQKLVIPVHRPEGTSGKKVAMGEIRIAYEEDWRRVHMKTLESAYRKSPYFEFYADQVASIIYSDAENLTGFNLDSIVWGAKVLELDVTIKCSTTPVDQRSIGEIRQKLANNRYSNYIQVFDERHGFMHDLSVLDLLFNLGPEASSYIRRQKGQL